jgi:hypothetical protein
MTDHHKTGEPAAVAALPKPPTPLEARPNGTVPHDAEPLPLPPQRTTHVFSEREKAFFVRQIQQMNAMQGAVQTAIALVMEQQALEGNWRLRQDGSGLERFDPTA